MTCDALSDFLTELHDAGDLRRIGVPVDPAGEIAEITDRFCKLAGGGPALLFEQVRGHAAPVVTNLLGSRLRIARALGCRDYGEAIDRLSGHSRTEAAESWLQRLRGLATPGANQWQPRVVKAGPVQQIVRLGRDVDLRQLPLPASCPQERGVLHGAVIHARHPESGGRIVETAACAVRGPRALALHWGPASLLASAAECHRAAGTTFPVAVSLGGDPILHLLPYLPVLLGQDPLALAGLLRGRGLELVRGRQIEVEVPSQAEFIFEGIVDARVEPDVEAPSPLGDDTGHLIPAAEAPLLQVAAVTHRSNPVLVARIVGKPPMEEFWLREAGLKLRLPMLREAVPGLVDCHLPRSGSGLRTALVSLRKTRPWQAHQVIHALWGQEWFSGVKLVVVVDEGVPVEDEEQAWYYVATHLRPDRDVVFGNGPQNLFDPAQQRARPQARLGLDATRKWPEERDGEAWPERTGWPRALRDLVTQRWAEYRVGPDPGESW